MQTASAGVALLARNVYNFRRLTCSFIIDPRPGNALLKCIRPEVTQFQNLFKFSDLAWISMVKQYKIISENHLASPLHELNRFRH